MSVVKCPVCNGNGMVSAGFYDHAGDFPQWVAHSTSPEQCRSCEGKGHIVLVESDRCPAGAMGGPYGATGRTE